LCSRPKQGDHEAAKKRDEVAHPLRCAIAPPAREAAEKWTPEPTRGRRQRQDSGDLGPGCEELASGEAEPRASGNRIPGLGPALMAD